MSRSVGPGRLMVLLALSWLPGLLGTGAIGAAGDLYPVIEAGNAYFVLRHALLLYAWIPLVVLSSFSLVLSPGLLAVLALGCRVELDRWIVYGFGVSVVLVSAMAAIAQAISGAPLTGLRFAWLLAGAALAAFGALQWRLKRRPALWLGVPAGRPPQLATFILPPALLLIGLLPKFFWDNFTGDGGHGYEAARLLLVRALPFWDPGVGMLGSFPGLANMLFLYPASWFLRLFGEFEATVRFPFLLYLVVLYAGLMSVARFEREPPTLSDRWLVWLGLTVFTVAMVFSDSYNPYHADIALPAAQNLLLMTCFMGFLAAFIRREGAWMALFLGLTMLAQANWALLIGLWLASVLLLWRPVPRRTLILAASLSLLGFLALPMLARLLEAVGTYAPGGEHATGQLIERLRYLRLSEWHRMAFLIVPGGAAPALYLLAWRKQDRVARALTLVGLGCFVFFYVQAFVALHYFVPAMVLPLAVLWRANPAFLRARAVRSAVLALGVAALLVSIPDNRAPHLHAGTVGRAVLDRRAGYESFEPQFFRQLRVYWTAFARIAAAEVPDELYGGAPHVWNYYAQRFGSAEDGSPNYVIQADTLPAPPGMRLIGSEAGASLYVASDSVWEAHRSYRPPSSIARLYALPRNVRFPFVGAGDPDVIDLAALWRRLSADGPRRDRDAR